MIVWLYYTAGVGVCSLIVMILGALSEWIEGNRSHAHRLDRLEEIATRDDARILYLERKDDEP